MAAVDFFLKIEGIEGESGDAKHKGAIELSSFNWGVSQQGTSGRGGGGGAGKVQVHELHCSALTNNASTKLMLACATGEHIKKAELFCRKAGKDQHEYLKITMHQVLISGYHVKGNPSAIIPVDEISINFGKVEMEYKPQKDDGTLGAAVKGGWDLAANKKV